MQARVNRGACPNFEVVDERGERAAEYDEEDFEVSMLCEGAEWVLVNIENPKYLHRGRTPEEAFLSHYLEALEYTRETYEEARGECEKKLRRMLAEWERGEIPREMLEREREGCRIHLNEIEAEVRRLERLVEGLRSGKYRVKLTYGESR